MNDSNTPESRRRQAVLMALARHPSRPEVAARLEAMIFTGRLTGDALLSGYLPASIALQESFQSEDVRYLSAMARLIDRVAAELANPSTLEPPKPVTPPAEVVPAPAVVQSEPTPVPAAGSVIVDQQRSGPDLKHIAAVYLREVSIGQYGAINRAAAKLKRLDGEPMGRTTLVNRLKEANEAKIHTGYPPER